MLDDSICYKIIDFFYLVFLDSLNFIASYLNIIHKYDVLLIITYIDLYNCNKCINHTLIK